MKPTLKELLLVIKKNKPMEILEIQKILKKSANKKVQANWQKFVPSLKKIYTVGSIVRPVIRPCRSRP